jgi:hypothetical protein
MTSTRFNQIQFLHRDRLEGDRQRDNQGIHDHLGEKIQNDLHGLACYIHEKEAPAVLPPFQFKDQSESVGRSTSVVSRL